MIPFSYQNSLIIYLNIRLVQLRLAYWTRGLRLFTPTVQYVPLSSITENKQRNIRNIKLKDFFHHREKKHNDYDPKAFKNLFTLRSTWVPSLSMLEKSTVQAIAGISSSY